MAETQNLMDGLFEQMNRAREIKKEYDKIPQGIFGSIMIQKTIDRAEHSIRNNDVVLMLSAYKELQEIK